MKAKITGTLLIAGLILLLFRYHLKAEETAGVSITSASNPSPHHNYTDYKIKNRENVIAIGCQPLYLPTSLITEAMKRDRVLGNALSELNMKSIFYSFLKGEDINFFLEMGDLDAGIAGDMSAIIAAATLDIIIPALIQQGFTSIIADRPMMMGELRGRNIGYVFGSNAHYALLKALSSWGLNEDKVALVPMEAAEMPDALADGKIDAFSAGEPTPEIALTKHPECVVLHRHLSSGYVVFLKSFSDKHHEAVRQIVAAEIRAIRWMQSNRQNLLQASEWVLEECAALSGRELELSSVQYAALALHDLIGITSVPVIPRNDLRQNGLLYTEFIFLQAKGKIHASINWDTVENCFDNQIIFEVLDNQKKYRTDKFNYTTE
ncbi:MAG: ABC transporter substrate-binding protein [Candidatus Scalindua sp.]|nr:ABC transporter substrate-binding protein [Candidatus Scalindua sp.]